MIQIFIVMLNNDKEMKEVDDQYITLKRAIQYFAAVNDHRHNRL